MTPTFDSTSSLITTLNTIHTRVSDQYNISNIDFNFTDTPDTLTITSTSTDDNYTIDYIFTKSTNTLYDTESDDTTQYDNIHHFILDFFTFFFNKLTDD